MKISSLTKDQLIKIIKDAEILYGFEICKCFFICHRNYQRCRKCDPFENLEDIADLNLAPKEKIGSLLERSGFLDIFRVCRCLKITDNDLLYCSECEDAYCEECYNKTQKSMDEMITYFVKRLGLSFEITSILKNILDRRYVTCGSCFKSFCGECRFKLPYQKKVINGRKIYKCKYCLA